jgi:ATP adenylyltransferase
VSTAYTLDVERLWTPWRRAFIEGARTDDEGACFLCTGPTEHDDGSNYIVFRGEQAFVVLNRYPYNNGHLMVAPYLHTGDLATLESTIASELMHLAQRCVDVLQRAYHPDAFNVGMNLGRAAGAGLPNHLHIHVVPRWNGDTNFMPILGETKVLPETLDQTFERLEPLFRG